MFVPSSRLVQATTLAIAAFAGIVDASPMLFNPVTPGGYHVKLTDAHPALGREIAAENYVAPVESRASLEDLVQEMMDLGGTPEPGKVSARNISEHRRLEAHSVDIERLEEHFQSPMERNLNLLPKQGAPPTTPWPGSYWAVYLDGLNAQWSPGQPSPAEKYATAFGLNVTEFEQKVSEMTGILSMQFKQPCTAEADCAPLNDGSTCAKWKDQPSGYCVPKWFGLCHAWAPAAMMEPEPKCPVTVGDVTFQPFDIKALLTELYDRTGVETVFTGTRFNGKDDEPGNRDEFGRFIDPTRRDLGPGFFHVAAANILGLRQQTFLVDVTAGNEVWNQPAHSYEVLEMKELTPEQAAVDFFKVETYPFNPVVQKIMYVKNRFKWVVESNEDGSLVPTQRVQAYVQFADYEYLLELDDLGNILGGEWIANSVLEHPDFLWFPAHKPALTTISRAGISYQRVQELLAASIAC